MKFNRASGVILHPTSLPGPDGMGDLGIEAFRWIDYLASTGCSYWQILPLGPTGYGDSPYQSFSAFAGNPYLISATMLLDENLLDLKDLADRPAFPEEFVDYGPVITWKLTVLDRAFEHYQDRPDPKLQAEYEQYKIRSAAWLDDFSLFMAIKESQGGVAWPDWPAPLRSKDPLAVQVFMKDHARDVERHAFRQFLFFRQWDALHAYARGKGIRILGDIPIFVAYDSSDVWAHPHLFFLNARGQPTVVAGVPPDYYSPTGQLWGNPLYRWDAHAEEGYAWWIERLKNTFEIVDLVRLDHFRGFAGYWEVPASDTTAEHGRWMPGPGAGFFSAVQSALSQLPIIAEDLGEITPDVPQLRDQFQLPGMKVLQFAFSTDATDPFLPHNYPVGCVVYTGTHDNDTTLAWYRGAPEAERDLCRRYLARSGEDIVWDLIRLAWSSVAMLAVAPMQDLLSLGSEARMNFPGKPSGNWSWRVPRAVMSDSLRLRLKETNQLYGRVEGLNKPTMQGHI